MVSSNMPFTTTDLNTTLLSLMLLMVSTEEVTVVRILDPRGPFEQKSKQWLSVLNFVSIMSDQLQWWL